MLDWRMRLQIGLDVAQGNNQLLAFQRELTSLDLDFVNVGIREVSLIF